MKLLTGLLGCIMFICYLQELSVAAPIRVKRDQEYRNLLFGQYSCHIEKAANTVRTKLNVRIGFDNVTITASFFSCLYVTKDLCTSIAMYVFILFSRYQKSSVMWDH